MLEIIVVRKMVNKTRSELLADPKVDFNFLNVKFSNENKLKLILLAGLNEYPWVVALFNNGRQFCGGKMIDYQDVSI